MTTGLAGGLLSPYKGLFPACARKAPDGFANRTTSSGCPKGLFLLPPDSC